MGYYSHFQLKEVVDEEGNDINLDQLKDFHNVFKDTTGYGSYVLDWYDSEKWYDFIEDMEKISKRYKSILFGIERRGENPDDHRLCRFLNGKSEIVQAKVTGEFKKIKKPYS